MYREIVLVLIMKGKTMDAFASWLLENGLAIIGMLIAAVAVRGIIKSDVNQWLNEKADHALKQLQEICADPDFHISVKLQSGNALLINNRKGLHARSSFKPTFGQNERWLIRANIRQDIWSMRNSSTDKWRAFH